MKKIFNRKRILLFFFYICLSTTLSYSQSETTLEVKDNYFTYDNNNYHFVRVDTTYGIVEYYTKKLKTIQVRESAIKYDSIFAYTVITGPDVGPGQSIVNTIAIERTIEEIKTFKIVTISCYKLDLKKNYNFIPFKNLQE
jgi:hypothetical protein